MLTKSDTWGRCPAAGLRLWCPGWGPCSPARSAPYAVAGGLAVPGGAADPALAQDRFLHLGGGGLGERAQELHVAGHREVRHAGLAEVEQRLRGERLSRGEHDARLHLVLAARD